MSAKQIIAAGARKVIAKRVDSRGSCGIKFVKPRDEQHKMPQTDLDPTDWRILDRLQSDARISNVDLARAVNLSPSPCLNRVRMLEQSGVIARYVSLLDPLKVGLTVSVFIQVSLEKQMRNALDTFEASVLARDEVME